MGVVGAAVSGSPGWLSYTTELSEVFQTLMRTRSGLPSTTVTRNSYPLSVVHLPSTAEISPRPGQSDDELRESGCLHFEVGHVEPELPVPRRVRHAVSDEELDVGVPGVVRIARIPRRVRTRRRSEVTTFAVTKWSA